MRQFAVKQARAIRRVRFYFAVLQDISGIHWLDALLASRGKITIEVRLHTRTRKTNIVNPALSRRQQCEVCGKRHGHGRLKARNDSTEVVREQLLADDPDRSIILTG